MGETETDISCVVDVGWSRQSRGGSIYSCRSGEVEGGSYRGDVPSTLVSFTPVDERLPPIATFNTISHMLEKQG